MQDNLVVLKQIDRVLLNNALAEVNRSDGDFQSVVSELHKLPEYIRMLDQAATVGFAPQTVQVGFVAGLKVAEKLAGMSLKIEDFKSSRAS